MDNATYRPGDDMSVRLPRYRRWVGQVEAEQRWLPWPRGRGLALAGSLPVPDDPFFDDPVRVTAALRHLDAIVRDRWPRARGENVRRASSVMPKACR
ncbi:hypothetical protein ACFVXC_19270 [Streptomyces sp. NPDC058257]|uniref:hypothetical protein n=1 Tax=Streptomyces sp. NPDC058257 TaxID=3346409 RepID=UPI0036E9D811